MAWAAGGARYSYGGDANALESGTRLGGDLAKSLLLHLLAAGALLAYGYVHGFFQGSSWGQNSTAEGAIQATLVSSAALPLPQDHPPTDNVLATDTPSPAPMLDQQKAASVPLPEAVPIPEKEKPLKRQAKVKTPAPPLRQPPPKLQHKAEYGEAAPANTARAQAQTEAAVNAPAAVTGGDFGLRFGWYVEVITRKVAQNWYTQEVQPGTPAGAKVYIRFTVARDGSVRNISIAASSGYASLDSSCLHAVQRVDSFGALPAGYNESSLDVSYYCSYPGSH